MIRLLTGILLSAVAGVAAFGQSQQALAPQPPTWLQDKAEVLRVVDLDEAEIR